MVLFSLTIVRHGETKANVEGIIQGQMDEPLNEKGREQAKKLGKSLIQCQQTFTHSFSSDLSRTVDTANFILDPHSQDKVCDTKNGITAPLTNNNNSSNKWKLTKDARVRERSFGTFENRPIADLKKEAEKHSSSVIKFIPPGGETWEELYERVVEFFSELCARLESEAAASNRREMSSAGPLSPYIGASDQLHAGRSVSSASGSSSAPQSPHCANPPQLLRSTSRKISRSSNLKSWPEERFALESACSSDEETTLVMRDGRKEEKETFDESLRKASADSTKFFVGSRRSSFENSSTDSFISQTQSIDSGFVPEGTNSDTPLTIDIGESSTLGYGSSGPGLEQQKSNSSSSSASTFYATSPYRNGVPTSPLGPSMRKYSMQSIASDDSFFPELDAKVLLVTHGGPIKELFRYFLEELHCAFPGGRSNALRRCPNTGVSTFMVCYDEGEVTSITCLDAHSTVHLSDAPTFNLNGPSY